MKKTISLILILIMSGSLLACASDASSHNGKSCPKGSESKTACNRETPGH